MLKFQDNAQDRIAAQDLKGSLHFKQYSSSKYISKACKEEQ